MNRREFVGWMGVGAIASSLPVAIAACFPDASQAQTGFLNVGTARRLETNGSIRKKKPKILVVRDPVNKTLFAVNPTCTHTGCTVRWQSNRKQFACPCHGARFNIQGGVVKGPAPRPLKRYSVKEENGAILVKVN